MRAGETLLEQILSNHQRVWRLLRLAGGGGNAPSPRPPVGPTTAAAPASNYKRGACLRK